jgi:hypothetical protein
VSVPWPASNRSSNGSTHTKLTTRWYTPMCINGYVLVRYTVDPSQPPSFRHTTRQHHRRGGETVWERKRSTY